MSSLELRVELPAYSYSFQIEVQTTWSMQAVKEEIRRVCPGSPQADGQRVIWRGRLLRDDEQVKDVWKTEDDARIIHLSIHPSAWTGTPPTPAQSRAGHSVLQPAFANPRHGVRRDTRAQFAPPPAVAAPLPYIVQKHASATHVLTHGGLPPAQLESVETSQLRTIAINAVQAYGWSWPPILDEEYPPSSTESEGVKYEQVSLENQQYLKLTNPGAAPTPIQLHALKVLSYTFPLLSVPYPPDPVMYSPMSPYTMPYSLAPTINLNQHLQQLGLPPLRLAPLQQPNQNPNDPNNAVAAEIRAIPIRALLMPLVMLTIRTFILMYFFSPSKRPVFGILLSLWILYETWGALRAVIGNERQGGAGGGARAEGGAEGANNAARPGAGQAQGAPGADAVNQTIPRRHSDFLLNYLANMNLRTEDDILNTDAPAPEPGLFYKARSFVGLFVMSLHPAMWDRRRGVLRRREGRLRTEANIRESAPPPEGEEATAPDAGRAQARAQVLARHERRPAWVRSYVERVLNTEWVDDS